MWRAFDAREPIGDRRLDFLAALLSHVLVSLQVKDAPPLSRFVVDWWSEEGSNGG